MFKRMLRFASSRQEQLTSCMTIWVKWLTLNQPMQSPGMKIAVCCKEGSAGCRSDGDHRLPLSGKQAERKSPLHAAIGWSGNFAFNRL